MNKRKKKTLAAIAKIIFVLVMTSVFIVVFSPPYRVKNGPVIAVEIEEFFDFGEGGQGDSFKQLARPRAKYFSNEGINTAILKINNGKESIVELDGFDYLYKDLKKSKIKDIIKQYTKIFSRNKIRLFISLDCGDLDRETVLNTVTYLAKEYKPAGIVIEKYYGPTDDIKWLADNIKKRNKTTRVWEKPVNTDYMAEVSRMNCVDGFICEYMSRDGYNRIKEEVKEKVLLHYTSTTMQRDIFNLTNSTGLDGAVVKNFTFDDSEKWEPLMIKPAFVKISGMPAFNLSVKNDFEITYPTGDFTTYYNGFLITGTGKPYGMVTVNDVEYQSGWDGTFSIYYNLKKGKNRVIISQDGDKKVFVVNKKVYGNSGVKYELPWDDTQWVNYGQIVQTTAPLTSVLSDPKDDSAIIAGLEPGTKMKIVAVEETTRNSRKTYAYKLSNGGYVMADKVKIINELTSSYFNPDNIDLSSYAVYDVPKIKEIRLEKQKNGDEILKISVNNNPAVFTYFEEDKFTVHLLDTTLRDAEQRLPDSGFFTDAYISEDFDGVRLEFSHNQNNTLWGWDVYTDENTVQIYLKKAPVISSGDKPLENVTIMLDAGHGGYDSGALGVAAANGPMEKDINLAVATATKALLEQWGADVVMTREDDSFPSLDDRRNMTREIRPDLFIAVHHNSMDYSYNSTDTRGSESYYFHPHSKKLADLLCENITSATDRRNLGTDTGYYYVTRQSVCPSALMEYSFLINAKDYRSTYSDKDIYNAAWGTLQAVLKTLQ